MANLLYSKDDDFIPYGPTKCARMQLRQLPQNRWKKFSDFELEWM